MPRRPNIKQRQRIATYARRMRTAGGSVRSSRTHVRLLNRPARTLSSRQYCFIPNTFKTVHTFSNVLTWALTTQTGTSQYWYGNSLSHCYNNTLAQKAMGFNQLGELYKKYQVWKARMEITLVANTEVANVLVGLNSDMDMTTVPTVNGIYDVLDKNPRARFLPLTSTRPVKLVLTRTSKSQNIKNDSTAMGTYDATTPVVPPSLWGFRILGFNNSGSTTDIRVYAKITYYTVWHEPQEQAGS